jgi:aspartate 1-decarboxylase
MKRTLLKSKIHRATVTEADLNYEGSISLDHALMRAADLVEFEQVDVYNITNGERLTTYAISAEPGSGTVQINGAAAHLVNPGDLVIVCSYAQFEPAELARHKPRIVLVDKQNRVQEVAAAVQ